MEQFQPAETVAALFQNLSQKENEVLRSRFGLGGGEPETLEDIGKRFGVTRERIRQIQSGALARLRAAKGFESARRSLEHLVVGALTAAGGAVEAEHLVRDLVGFADRTEPNRHAVDFLLTQVLADRIVLRAQTRDLKASWALVGTSDEPTLSLTADATGYLASLGKPVAEAELLQASRTFESVRRDPSHFTTDVILAMLSRSRAIATNPFGEWGLAAWGSIAPKRINDKIRVILERAGEPLHFTEIAKRINDARFDSRTAYAPTVHNELILNDSYVLVGRGLYALKSWGYREGVVADVVADVLRASAKPMKRNEIVEAVLAQRFVKRNTVHLALADRKRFTHNADGTYQLAEGGAA